jgi:hypothetical protein
MPGRLGVLCGCKLLLHHVGVQHAVLFQIIGNGILGQKRRLEPDFSSNPLAFIMRSVGRVVAASAAAELRTELGALNLIELLNLPPSGITDGS